MRKLMMPLAALILPAAVASADEFPRGAMLLPYETGRFLRDDDGVGGMTITISAQDTVPGIEAVRPRSRPMDSIVDAAVVVNAPVATVVKTRSISRSPSEVPAKRRFVVMPWQTGVYQ